MRKREKKLVLNRETIGALDLANVRGGEELNPSETPTLCECPEMKADRVQ